jgi:hypothetical protein
MSVHLIRRLGWTCAVAMFKMMQVLIFVRNLDMIPSLQVDFCRKTDE